LISPSNEPDFAMPEYLSPGVYVEESDFRAKPIEGVATSTVGFAGMTRYGPVNYPGGPRMAKARSGRGSPSSESRRG